MMKRNCRSVALSLVCLAGVLQGAVVAASFSSPENLVVIRCTAGVGAEKILVDEYDVSGASPVLVQTITLPYSGPDAITMAGVYNHDRHVHRSVDGRFITFTGYARAYVEGSQDDPSVDAALTTPRVVAIVKYDGSVDLSTRLTDAYDYTAIRAAVTTDGNDIWVAGDNASGATTSGGTRFTTKGSSTTVNLSQVQTLGSPTPDNIRDLNIFADQLYNSSGSSSSVGKAIFRVGTGLPKSGSQPLTRLTTDGSSTVTFYFLDANPAVAGVDTIYAASSIGGTFRKYNLVGSTWTPKGLLVMPNGEPGQVTAKLMPDGRAMVYVGHAFGIYRYMDPQPYGSDLSGDLGIVYLAPAEGYALGGFDFAPTSACNRPPADTDGDGDVDLTDFGAFSACFNGPNRLWAGSPLAGQGCACVDLDGDGDVDLADFGGFSACFNGPNRPPACL